ncbi:hypothetical protein VCHA27O13_20014 [Vibrio chagasii]|nr:hypothetical protein VCHA27O13_20014 [Vibrio chagasii]CAH6906384.1 hypothetical protein VCHA37P191_100014 [Vibrio chagasii]CAH6924669.1 hypothetical protein VCHA29O37_390047 [Vibrio chagasii]CAH7057355.1 hypothetical protein VCHA34P121_70148 [Vibrio chagasii]CAH7120479.1 hypothetical protein VCHA41O249_240013 [Vibrio chagasii]
MVLPLAKWLASFAVAALAVNDMIDAIKQKMKRAMCLVVFIILFSWLFNNVRISGCG